MATPINVLNSPDKVGSLVLPSLSAEAFDILLSVTKDDQDTKSSFHKQMLCQPNNTAVHGGTEQQKKTAVQALSSFIKEMDDREQRDHKKYHSRDRLRPLVIGLYQFASKFDTVVKAGPEALTILYNGARLVLQVISSLSCFSLSSADVLLS